MRASHCSGSYCCGAQAQGLQWLQYVSLALWLPGSRAQARQLWHMGAIACGSSHSRDHTYLSSTGKWILYHGATREALRLIFDSSFPHMYPVREARIKRPSHWEFSATGLAVPSKALGPLVSASASLGLFPPLRNALMLDCSPPSSSVSGISEARILEGVPLPSLQGSIWKIFSPGLWF